MLFLKGKIRTIFLRLSNYLNQRLLFFIYANTNGQSDNYGDNKDEEETNKPKKKRIRR